MGWNPPTQKKAGPVWHATRVAHTDHRFVVNLDHLHLGIFELNMERHRWRKTSVNVYLGTRYLIVYMCLPGVQVDWQHVTPTLYLILTLDV